MQETQTQAPNRGESATRLSPVARLLLWDYERGSLPYDLVCLIVLLLLLLLPPHWLGDPMIPR
jgi:hypothetical protein